MLFSIHVYLASTGFSDPPLLGPYLSQFVFESDTAALALRAGFIGEDASKSVSCSMVGSPMHWGVMLALARFPTWVTKPTAREAP